MQAARAKAQPLFSMVKEAMRMDVTRFMLPTSHYDETKAGFVVTFIEALKHTKGEWHGQPFRLLPWQSDLIRTVFGVIAENGFRQCKTCYVEIGKKNGKTMLAAALSLYLLIADGEYGAEIYSCAADRQQASLVYSMPPGDGGTNNK